MEFKPAWWLPGPHLQTLWPTLCRRPIKELPLKRERFELPDGDFVDLDWTEGTEGPIVLMLHGLEGSIESPYAKGMLKTFVERGWRGVFMHFRSCSGEPNRLPRAYHSGDTQDVATVIKALREREANTPFAAIGVSLGGNVLLKWLGESGAHNPLKAAIAVSVPFELHKAASRLQKGFSKLYQWHLLKCLRKKFLQKLQQPNMSFDLSLSSLDELEKLRTLHDFDDKVTAPLHGFTDADHYYTHSSSRQYLRNIQVPTLLIQAKDDPFMTDDLLPSPEELPSHVTLEITSNGGHVGFVTGNLPWRAEYWLEQRAPDFLQKYL